MPQKNVGDVIENLEGEIWKDVVGYEGRYIVSNMGRVWSLTRRVKECGRGKCGVLGRFLQTGPRLSPPNKGRLQERNWYPVVNLSKSNIGSCHQVHALVWAAFIGTPDRSLEINHKNGIKYDNRLENLEVITHGDNVRHAFRTGLVPLGENRIQSKLTVSIVIEMRKRFGLGQTYTKIGKDMGYGRKTVSDAVQRKTWKHVP